MEEPRRHVGRERLDLEWVEGAALTQLEALQNFVMRGWTAPDSTFVALSEEKAAECSVRAFKRLLKAVARSEPTVMQLLAQNEPDSPNAYRMLRWMMKLSAYDVLRESGQYRQYSSGAGRGGGATDDAASSSDGVERLIRSYRETHPGGDPLDLFETYHDLGRVVGDAIRLEMINNSQLFILLAHLAGREDADIAAELGLETQQVQRHMYKIREALREANRGLEGDD